MTEEETPVPNAADSPAAEPDATLPGSRPGTRTPPRTIAVLAVGAIIIAGVAFAIGRATSNSNDTPVAAGAVDTEEEPTTRKTTTTAAERDRPTSTEAATTTTVAVPSVGDEAISGGITLTVTEAESSDSLPPGVVDAFHQDEPTTAPEGGRYIIVRTHGKNGTNVPVDPSCGLEIDVRLYDIEERQYDHVESLMGLNNNPECGTAAQPGFEFDMTWIFLVPESAEGFLFAFVDDSDRSAGNEAEAILLPADL